jgi:hypothetical protein
LNPASAIHLYSGRKSIEFFDLRKINIRQLFERSDSALKFVKFGVGIEIKLLEVTAGNEIRLGA